MGEERRAASATSAPWFGVGEPGIELTMGVYNLVRLKNLGVLASFT